MNASKYAFDKTLVGILIFISVLLLGCNIRENGITNLNPNIINITQREKTTSLSFKSAFSEIEYVVLEATTPASLIYQYSQIDFTEDRIYCFGARPSNTRLVVFSRKGKHLFTIDNNGESPN